MTWHNPNYVSYCDEHEVPLNPDGTCPTCRDENGQPFVLDTQSIYLVKIDLSQLEP